jgi:ornithine carbamoyltransferase
MPVKPRIAARPTFAVVTFRISVFPLRDPLAARSIMATMTAAERLRAQARAGTVGQPLRGKNLALLLGPPASGDIASLRRAAQELGARVAELRFTEPASTAGERDEVLALARMMGRMYDAVDCEAVAPATASRIEHEAGVPVYHGLCLDEHPARVLGDVMTLREHRLQSDASIQFLGDPKAPRAIQFASIARAAGFDVLAGSGQPASSDAKLLVDARHSTRWTLMASARPLDEARRLENYRCVMQAMLLDTIIKA